jgi:hypothetical protein
MDANQNTPLHKACYGGKLKQVKNLVDSGADISAVNLSGSTPLHKACYNGHLEVVKFLIDNGADISAVNCNGLPPLQFLEDVQRKKMEEYASFHVRAALDLFRSRDGWSFPIVGTHIYKRSGDATKCKVLSLDLGQVFGDCGKRHVPYLRYYYNHLTEEVESEIMQIREMIDTQYMKGKIQVNTHTCPRIPWDVHCVFQKDRRCRLTTLYEKYRNSYIEKYTKFSIEELKYMIKRHPDLSIIRRDGHLYVNGLRFKGARCLDVI